MNLERESVGTKVWVHVSCLVLDALIGFKYCVYRPIEVWSLMEEVAKVYCTACSFARTCACLESTFEGD